MSSDSKKIAMAKETALAGAFPTGNYADAMLVLTEKLDQLLDFVDREGNKHEQ